MKKLFLFAFIIMISNCTLFELDFFPSVNDTIYNNEESLGFAGTRISSSDPAVAIAEIKASGTVKITSLSSGFTRITVSKIPDFNAYIDVSVLKDGTITIIKIEKYKNKADIGPGEDTEPDPDPVEPDPDPVEPDPDPIEPAPDKKTKHVIFIGLDGWGGDFMDRANMPTLQQMISNGASSMKVSNVLPSASWPNWLVLFTGTPMENQTGKNFPSVFTVIKNNLIKNNNYNKNTIALYGEWDDIFLIPTDDEAVKNKIYSTQQHTNNIAKYIRDVKPVFLSVVYDEPDITGHNFGGWGSENYYKILTMHDGFINTLKQAYIDAGIYEDTVFIFSSDHGGYDGGTSHYFDRPDCRHIPLVIFGNGIKKGYEIPSSTMIYDIAPTILHVLGYEIPSEWTGSPIMGIFK